MRWVLRGGCVVLAACVPLVAKLPGVLALLLLLPVAVECCRAAGETPVCVAGIGVFGAVCCWALPSVALPALGWCGAGIAMCLIHHGSAKQRGLAWGCMCIAMVCALLVWANLHYAGQVYGGLAEDLASWVNEQDNAGEILLRCYQMGFSRLEDDLQPVINLLGMLVMTPQVRMQLVYSLRTTLESLLAALLPQVIVGWALVTAVLAASLPDVVRRRRGQRGELLPFTQWRMTDRMRRFMNVLALGYLLQLMGTSAVTATVGSLCGAAFQYGYTLLGLAVMEGITKQYGTARPLRRLWMLVCLLLAPIILVILGIADWVLDPRKLRRMTDHEGGNEQ